MEEHREDASMVQNLVLQADAQSFLSMDVVEASSHSDVALLEQEKSRAGMLQQGLPVMSPDSRQRRELHKKPRVLTLGLVLPICYFLACGGPADIEPIVESGGPLVGLIGLVVFPIIFSIPFALLVSEMCTAFPGDGGFVIWVTAAFGPFWGFQEGFLSWVSAILNNALYPRLLMAALKDMMGEIGSPVVEYALEVCFVAAFSMLTLFGAKVVGKSSLIIMFLVLVPFMMATIWFFVDAKDYDVLLEMPVGLVEMKNATHSAYPASADPKTARVHWQSLVTRLFWTYDDIHIVSLFGGQVLNPSYTYPRAIILTLFLTVISYELPLMGALAVDKLEWNDFHEGSFGTIAGKVGGCYLQVLLIFSAICSNAGMFTTATFARSYQVHGMAEQGLMPKVFAKRHILFDTPYISLMLHTVPVLFLMAFEPDWLLDVGNCLSAISQVLIIVAAIKLRIDHDHAYQIKMIPGGKIVVILVMTLPLAVVGYVTYASLSFIAAGVVVVGIIYHVIKQRRVK